MRRYVIEIQDSRDKDALESWSFFAAGSGDKQMKKDMIDLVSYLHTYPTITEVRVKLLDVKL